MGPPLSLLLGEGDVSGEPNRETSGGSEGPPHTSIVSASIPPLLGAEAGAHLTFKRLVSHVRGYTTSSARIVP